MSKTEKTKYPIIRLVLVIGTSILLIIIISVFTFDNNTMLVFQQINLFYLLLLFLVWTGLRLMDTCALFLYSRGFSNEVTIWKAFRAVAIRIFYNIITPFNFGGQPMVVHELTKYNISYGNGYSIVFNKHFIYTCISTAGGIFAFFAYKQQIDNYPGVRIIFFISGILSILLSGLFICGFIFPKLVVSTTERLEKILKFFRIIKKDSGFKKRIITEMISARKSFSQFFTKNINYFITGTACIILQYAGRLVLLWLILKSIGLNVTFCEGCILSALILLLIAYIPTPGSVGLGEALVAFLAANNIPLNLLGIVLLLWRFFYQYLGALIGAFFSLNNISKYVIAKVNKT